MREPEFHELVEVVFNTPNGQKLLKALTQTYVFGFSPSSYENKSHMMISLGKEELVKDLYDMANNKLEG